jgi:hypothetical protein
MPGPGAFLDECTHLELVDALRRRGFTATSLQVVGPRGAPDEVVLQRATELGYVLVTHNVNDFKIWHETYQRQGQAHGGIIGLPQTRPFPRLELRVAMMLDWLGTQPHTSRLFQWGSCNASSSKDSDSPATARLRSGRFWVRVNRR